MGLIIKKVVKYLILILLLFSGEIRAQNSDIKYVPVQIEYLGHNKVPWQETSDDERILDEDKYIWAKIINYSFTNPNESDILFSKNKNEYQRVVHNNLKSRKECDSIVNYFVNHHIEKFNEYHIYGKGAFYSLESNKEKLHTRCVCLPASELATLPHGDIRKMGYQMIYFEPIPFFEKFRKFGLDTVNLVEAPYYTIFPMDISPSFDCSKAKTIIEKSICRDSELANLDKRMAEVYLKSIRDKGDSIKEEQRKWIIEIDKLIENKNNDKIILILKEQYTKRIAILSK